MPATPALEDTRNLLSAGLTPPARARHTWMGGCVGFAVLLWVFATISVVRSVNGVVPGIVAGGLIIAAATMTVVACVLSAIIALWRAMTAEHKRLSEDIGRIAAQQEQISEKLGRIDPWTIYTAVAADVLGVEHRPGPKP